MKTSKQPAADSSDKTRERILRAALHEFSAHGLAGARTDAIAESAKVNKALLYYYFKNKESLYAAAFEEVLDSVLKNTHAVLETKCTPGEHLLRLALNHFDRILTQHEFQSLIQQEMVRFQHGETTSMPLLATRVFSPLLKKIQATVQEGIRSGELCSVDWMQVMYSSFGPNVFYFMSAPMMRLTLSFEPFDPAIIESRRKATINFLGNALFVDRAQGAKLARRVLAAMPMPAIGNPSRLERTL
ncbi:TetR/AcrR family transcriptional regulator [Edaphobacter paludis]|uniref:TetR/AcrR family transcriptional regulator n=1 Tax=Edaphobacter paludis TaxID=3035702 RepID=A0AAU7D1K3_9BACT